MGKRSKLHITVTDLHKMLGKIIEKGYGRYHVAVDKTTFTDNREIDGCMILDATGIRVERVLLAGDDGGIATTKAGLERSTITAVIHGWGYDPSKHNPFVAYGR